MQKAAILLFVKNFELGKVKTRLAKTIGDEKALEIYKKLVERTEEITHDIAADKYVFYSDFIPDKDLFDIVSYRKNVQAGNDLGERMLHAFETLFDKGYEKVIIIGSDCFALEAAHINEAFATLEKNEIVIGPAEDGGYYLLGMTNLVRALFLDKKWSTSDLLLDTILEIKQLGKSYQLLATLNDIDEENDLTEELLNTIK